MSKSNDSESRASRRGAWAEVGIGFGLMGFVVVDLALAAASASPTESVVVGNAPISATQSNINGSYPVTLGPGTELTAYCRTPDSGLVEAHDTQVRTIHQIAPIYEVSPKDVQLETNPQTPTAEWVGKLAVCGQQQ